MKGCSQIGALILAAILLACAPAASQADAPLKADSVVVYKAKRKLYLYSGGKILKTCDIALGKSPAGHKRQEGDGRTPEGKYVLDWRNPDSKYHLSLHISYPNEADRKRAKQQGVSPGGDIMLHGYPGGAFKSWWSRYWFLGRDWTDGCIAVSNSAIEYIWKSVDDGDPIQIHP